MKTRLNQITEHVYWLPPDDTTDRPILGVIAGNNGSLIVDAGNSPAHANLLFDELARVGLAQPKFLVLTHWHWDHVFGTAMFNTPIIAHQETRRIVAEMTQLDWSDEALDRRVAEGIEIEFCRDMIKAELPDRTNLKLKSPDIAFTDQIEIDLGNVTCRVIHVGRDHAADSSIVYIPQDKVVFLGDCTYPDLYSTGQKYTTLKFFPLLDQLLDYEADFYFLAHDPDPFSNARFVEYATIMKIIGQIVEQEGENREVILQELKKTGINLSDKILKGYIDEFLI